MLLTDPLDTLVESVQARVAYLLAYSLGYTVYAWLTYKVFDPLIGDTSISRVNPRLYASSTIVSAVVGSILTALPIVGLVGRLPTAISTIYPGVGLLLVAVHPTIRLKPYRFLLIFPLLGQAVSIRTLFIDAPASTLLFLLADKLSNESLIAWSSLIRGLLFPIPGFGGAQASLATADFLRYLGSGSTVPLLSAPVSFSAAWIFVEWLLFYRGLERGLRGAGH